MRHSRGTMRTWGRPSESCALGKSSVSVQRPMKNEWAEYTQKETMTVRGSWRQRGQNSFHFLWDLIQLFSRIDSDRSEEIHVDGSVRSQRTHRRASWCNISFLPFSSVFLCRPQTCNPPHTPPFVHSPTSAHTQTGIQHRQKAQKETEEKKDLAPTLSSHANHPRGRRGGGTIWDRLNSRNSTSVTGTIKLG